MTSLFHMTDRRFGMTQIENAILAMPDQMLMAADKFGTRETGIQHAKAMMVAHVKYHLSGQEQHAILAARNWMQL